VLRPQLRYGLLCVHIHQQRLRVGNQHPCVTTV
jgi:hypothetical protein